MYPNDSKAAKKHERDLRHMINSVRRLLPVVLMTAVLLPFLPGQAHACSCAELTVAQALEQDYYESAAVAIVRRIDDGADIEGQVEVVEEISGDLPDVIDLTYDNGGSCQPSIGVGQIAGLLIDTSGGDPVVPGCSKLNQASVLEYLDGPLVVDPGATGEPALVVSGDMPGAGLAVLDTDLRALAVSTDRRPSDMVVCNGALATLGYEGEGLAVTVLSLRGLEVMDQRLLPDVTLRSAQELSCHDGQVWLLFNGDEGEFDFSGVGLLFVDVMAGDPPVELPGFNAGSAGGGRAALVTSGSETNSRISVVDRTGQVVQRIDVDTDHLYRTTVSPDGATVMASGGDQQTFAYDASTGEELARRDGGYTYLGDRPWLTDDRIPFVEGPDAFGTDQPVTIAINDRRLQEVDRLQAPSGVPIRATTVGIVVTTPDGLAMLDHDGASATGPRQTALADQIVGVAPFQPPELDDQSDDAEPLGSSTPPESPRTATVPASPEAAAPLLTSEAPQGMSTAQAGAAVVGGTALAAIGAMLIVSRRR